MKSIPIIGHTRRLGAPQNWNHETDGLCHTLEILDTPEGFMVSAWLPTAAEQERIARGAPIYLHIQGVRHPVVALAVGEVSEIVETESGK